MVGHPARSFLAPLFGFVLGFGLSVGLACSVPSQLDDDVCRAFDEATCEAEPPCRSIRGTEVLGDCKQQGVFADCLDTVQCIGQPVPYRDEIGVCWLVPSGCLNDAAGWTPDDSCPGPSEVAQLPEC